MSASPHIVPPPRLVKRLCRESNQQYAAKVFWLTGPSGAGKSTIAHSVEQELFASGIRNVTVLDGDRIRSGLCSDLGFSPEARHENIRRAAHVARLFVEQGVICLCSFVSPHRADREKAAAIVGASDFYEVHIACPQAICEERDVKGFYRLARQGVIQNYTGVSSPYEKPENAALVLRTDTLAVEENVKLLQAFILRAISLERRIPD
jgi:adenylylsulfate kinase